MCKAREVYNYEIRVAVVVQVTAYKYGVKHYTRDVPEETFLFPAGSRKRKVSFSGSGRMPETESEAGKRGHPCTI